MPGSQNTKARLTLEGSESDMLRASSGLNWCILAASHAPKLIFPHV
jgi:hypothetical protein